MMTTQTATHSLALPGGVRRESAPLLCAFSLDELDNHQRSLREEYRAKAEYNIFHTHDKLETRYSKLERSAGIEAATSVYHLKR